MKESIGGIKHPAFRDALALTRTGGRSASGRYLIEDAEMVRQALESPSEVIAVFATPEESVRLEAGCQKRGVPLFVASGGVINKLIGTGYETTVTAVAVVTQLLVPPEALWSTPDALILCGEHIQDPRNIGVLVRTAEAVGCSGILLSSDSAEPYSRHATRSTTGSILRLPVAISENLPGTLENARKNGVLVVASSGQAETSLFEAELFPSPFIMVVGNEQTGVSEAIAAATDLLVRLPMKPNGADSLNVTVAAGALLYEVVRQRTARK